MSRATTKSRRKVLFHRASAVFWAVLIFPAYLWWRDSVAFVIAASIYANVKSDWGAAEAADNRDVIQRLEGIENKQAEILDKLGEKDVADDRPDRHTYEGPAIGGPLATEGDEVVISRFPKGIVAVSNAQNKAWIYDYAEGKFVCRDEDGDELDQDRAFVTAEQPVFEVVAVA